MSAKIKALSLLSRTLTSASIQRWHFNAHALGRKLRGGAAPLAYFHQIDDPHSHLAAQALRGLVDRYGVDLTIFLVGSPSEAEGAQDPARAPAWALRDAALIAPHLGARFPSTSRLPDPRVVDLAGRLALDAIERGDFADAIVHIGDLVWAGDEAGLEAMGPKADAGQVAAAREAGQSTRRSRGHWLSATFNFAGRWYWGLDRLACLEEDLDAAGVRRPAAPPGGALTPPPAPQPPIDLGSARSGESGQTVEFFFSLRSPYSYLALSRVFDLERRLGIRLVPRPVLPMVMRGFKVPLTKRIGIVLDAGREARRHGIPFGNIADPVGAGVERALAVIVRTIEAGGDWQALTLSLCAGAMAEGVDLAQDAGLRSLVERAGLDWAEAQAAMEDNGWREIVEENRRILMDDLGLWGVPCFRVGPHAIWGQDRIWLVEALLKAGADSHGAGS